MERITVSSRCADTSRVNASRRLLSAMSRLLPAHRRARHSARQLDEILASNPSAIFTFDLTGDVTYANARAFELLGVKTGDRRGVDFDSTRWERRTLDGEPLPGGLTPFRRVTTEREGFSDWRYRLRSPDGRWRVVTTTAVPLLDARGAIASVVVTTTDLTDQTRLEHDTRQAQKLEGLGHLAGGVAHDFNNLLTGIFGYLDLLDQNVATSSPGVRADIGEIRAAAERAAWLTRQLLTFSRRQVVTARDFDLNTIVVKTERFLGRVLGESVSLVVMPSEIPCHVHADPGQLEQVLLNLAVNARDAMPDGGSIVITTSNERVEPDAASTDLAPGDYVVLRVRDNGVGMSEDVLTRIFEPYFTTKEPTKGTGIGLATVYGIVTQAKGVVRVCSTVGLGSTFSVFMPAAAMAPPLDEGPTDERELKRAACTGVILLVDDNDAVRLVTRRLMEHAGLAVVEARNPAEALAIVAHAPEPFAMLATDLVMPGMSGKALAQRMREQQPHLPVLFLSGFTSESLGDAPPGGPRHRFLAKPYTACELLSAVSALAGDRDTVDGAEPNTTLATA
jgi:two-component system cell cycle sensor histidine kinase/response regulator CckA